MKVTVTRNGKTVGSCMSAGVSCTIRLPKGASYLGTLQAFLPQDGEPAGLSLPLPFAFAT